MSTTIQIDTETKASLFNLKNEIEKEMGKKITYNDVILILMKKQKQLDYKKQASVPPINARKSKIT